MGYKWVLREDVLIEKQTLGTGFFGDFLFVFFLYIFDGVIYHTIENNICIEILEKIVLRQMRVIYGTVDWGDFRHF